MKAYLQAKEQCARRRAVVAVQVGVMLVVLLGFAVLTVDVGALYNARADLQRAADSAALAGVSALVTDDMMRIRQGTADGDTAAAVLLDSETRSHEFGGLNLTFGLDATFIADADILIGQIDLTSAVDPLVENPPAADLNAVQVNVRRESDGAGTNGPIQLFFAPIFGHFTAEASATGVAAFDDRVVAISFDNPQTNTLPFTIHRDAFNSDWNSGQDQYGWNGNEVTSAADGIREVRLYPYPLSGGPYEDGDGNFGVLNIGTGNQGVEAEREQILNGVTAADMEMEIGTSTPSFYDDEGGALTYQVTGSPGMEATLQAAIGTMVGEVVGFFLHDNVVLSGANATYTISEMRFGRVMAIRLTGPPSLRGLYIQPVSYVGSDVIIDPAAPSTNGLMGRLVLVR